MLSDAEISDRFRSHEVTSEGQERITYIRSIFAALSRRVNAVLPEGRPKSLALTELENSALWAIKSLAEGYKVEYKKEEEPNDK